MLFRKAIAFTLAASAFSVARAQQTPQGPTASDVGTYSSLLAMTDTRQLDTLLIDKALGSRWQTLRAAAALAIGQVGPERGMAGAARLRGLLRDSQMSVAANAAYALGLLRDSTSIGALRLQASNHVVAREAAWALGEIGAASRNAITSDLDSVRDPDVLIQLLLAAAKLRPVPVQRLLPFLHNASPAVVWAAAYAIARSRSPAGVRSLIALAAEPRITTGSSLNDRFGAAMPYGDPVVAPARTRAEIARGLAKSAAGDSLGAQAFAILSRLAADPDPHVRINAARSLGTYGKQANTALVASVRDRDPNVRIAAAQSFASVIGNNTDEFRQLWTADTTLAYRSSLLASATRAGLRPPELSSWATSRDWKLRAAVASAEGDTLDRSFAISRALPLTKDQDPRVREAAYGALAPAASLPLEDSIHAALVSGLSDPDFYVRATILGSLAERPSARDLPAVLASYRLASRDSANDARLAALQYVAALWPRDSSSIDSAQRAALAQLATPSDPLERAAGKGVPPWRGWQTVNPVARPTAWYDNIVRTIVVPAASGRSVTATIRTVRGPIKLELFGADAPITVWNFLSLARSGYYRNTRFHRVVPNFVAQDGDPRDDGNGGPGYAIRDEMNRHRYDRGAVGMALSGPDTGGSQYFITHSPQPHLDGHYTVFGRVVEGYDVLDRLVQGDLIPRVDPK
jgi:cyclophilin family peptidyl-prolyl cis-trans isomerase/HEAT repeat protein